ncbi:RnfH family protein [Pseudomonas asplenii]|uniref:RnfH family protein n=1 Tax=Pseudomonas asplenii TaxID=53407 RepID=UPI00041477B9|nr:RnfH family protein [Pseudomonas asplenii]UZE28442.1 RnfH family protein [Pseudomonas asplenii]
MAESSVAIEVVYAEVGRQCLLDVSVPAGTTLRAAVGLSGMAEQFPEADLSACPLGIFGKVVNDPEVRVVAEGDRIEIYRPLLADPKEVRRLRAQKAAQARLQNP